MKHTPGPWRWNRYHPSGIELYGDCDSGPDERYLGELDARDSIADHDARLIAAAPDLLEALQELESHGDANERVSEPWIKARAAIAKATGEDDDP